MRWLGDTQPPPVLSAPVSPRTGNFIALGVIALTLAAFLGLLKR